jgi:hypothetical protein
MSEVVPPLSSLSTGTASATTVEGRGCCSLVLLIEISCFYLHLSISTFLILVSLSCLRFESRLAYRLFRGLGWFPLVRSQSSRCPDGAAATELVERRSQASGPGQGEQQPLRVTVVSWAVQSLVFIAVSSLSQVLWPPACLSCSNRFFSLASVYNCAGKRVLHVGKHV